MSGMSWAGRLLRSALLCTLVLTLPKPVSAQVANVSTMGELRTAIGDPGVSAINIDPGTYLLTSSGSGPLSISRDLTITNRGGGDVIIDADDASRTFMISGGATVMMTALIIQNGDHWQPGVNIYLNGGDLTVSASTVRDGYGDGANGAGIYVTSGSRLRLDRTTVSGNWSDGGSGGGVYNAGTLIATNSTFSGNTANGSSGGGIYNSGTATFTNSTIASNQAPGGSGGGIHRASGTVRLQNTIVADNSNGQIRGTIVSNESNLVEGGCSGCTARDLTGDPNLGALGDNGGPTWTHALLTGSIAIDAADPADAPATDQRGITRPQGPAPDIGGFEKGKARALTLPLYLDDSGVPTASLTTTAPSQDALPNYDPGRDSYPGLLLQRTGDLVGEDDPRKYQIWVGAPGPVDLKSPVVLVFWSAIDDFDSTREGAVEAGLFECEADGTKCLLIVRGSQAQDPWSPGSGSWVERSIDFGTVTHSIPSGRALAVKVIVDGASGDDMMFAYWTTAYPSRLDVSAKETNPPDPITDLAAGAVTASSVQLTWTAPGDDGATGTATSYDIRYSTSPITDANWASASHATDEPSPQVAGTAESFTAKGLSVGTTYYFAIKTSDEVPNESALSNVPSAATPGPEPSLSSSSDQTFWVGKAPTAMALLTVADTGAAPSVTAASDIRVRVPAAFNMSWDASDLTATIGGVAASKVSTTVTYEDAGKTLVLDVTSDFAVGDTITVAGLSFMDFTAPSAAGNLELEVYNDDLVSATDDRTVTVLARGAPTISSEEHQGFRVGDPPLAIGMITIQDDAQAPAITAVNDIRVRIPSSFNMTWDASDLTATILGTGTGKVSSTVSYEDGGKTLVLDVTADFDPNDVITISDLSYSNFTAASTDDNLELEVDNDGSVTALDDKTIFIVLILFTPDIHSSGDQSFTVGGAPTRARMIRITDDVTPQVTAANDMRIRIPDGIDMTWDATVGWVMVMGPARSKVSNTPTYEDGGKTLVLDVTTDFAPNDWIILFLPTFRDFMSASAPVRLELEVYNDEGVAVSIDDRTKQIFGGSYDVGVWPDTVLQERLPSNGTNYTVDFTVANIGSIVDDYDVLTSTGPGGVISVVSITGPGVTQGASPDSARVSSLAMGATALITVSYTVADVAAGSPDTLFVTARSVGAPTKADGARLELTVIRPNMTTTKGVSPSATQAPGTDLTYTLTVTNDGSAPAVASIVVDSIPVELEFKLGTVATTLPAGVSATVEYSNDGAASYSYTPVSDGCSAPAGYDGCVTHVRWTLSDDLDSTAPDNSGAFEFVARIR